jgi:hypothetical protein
VPGALICLVFACFIAVAIALMVLAHKAAQERMRAMQAFAAELGLSFDSGSYGGWDRQWPRFECFAQGHSRRAFNLMTGPFPGGTRGETCVLGDYEFKETHGSGKNRRTVTYRFGFLIVITRWHGIPDVQLRAEHMFDKVAGFLGFDDIDFESAEFSRKYHVKSSDKRFAYDLIDPQMMDFLLGPNTPMIDLGDNAFVLSFGRSTRLGIDEYRALLGWAREFLARWPRVVVARLDEGAR